MIQQAVRVDLRTRVLDVPQQDVISRDNVSVKVNAVIYYRILDAEKSVIQVEDFQAATSQFAQTTLRSVLGQHELDEMLAERMKLNADIQRILDEQTEAWGIKVSNVEIKRVDLDESMIRAIARQAEAERGRRAKIIDAEGELQAAQRFMEAAQILATQPQAMQLRYLTTLQGMATDRSSLIVFPLPLDLLQGFASGAAAKAGRNDAGPRPSGRLPPERDAVRASRDREPGFEPPRYIQSLIGAINDAAGRRRRPPLFLLGSP